MSSGKMTYTIEIRAHADVSEAQMNEYLSELGKSIANDVLQKKHQSWQNRIYTDYEEYSKVELDFTFKADKETY